ncbi:MAG: TonB-dependent receptor, partial [Prevotella sp.]|nr:TonB-dependent receptor [Prevotella sp.]
MQKKLKLAVIALCCTSAAFAQNTGGQLPKENTVADDDQAFTFTEAQLGEDDDMSQNVTIINSNSNLYASQVGYLFSPVRFRYRAFNQKYNEIYINGAPMNDMESGQFRYSMVGGLNAQTRNMEFALPFEANNFAMSAMGGSNNYNFRPSSQPVGNRVTLSGANRNYTLRAGYTFNSGLSEKGWAWSAAVMYRWANRGYVEGTFYNSLSYFLGVEKVFNDKHSLSLVTWGNPTERASQGAATDEAYWLANDRYYNPYWGYQNGKKRNSRVVNDFAPTALLTWDWKINDYMKLTTALTGKYSHYKSTKLNYSNSDNPHPNYWKNLPSSFYDVWDETDATNRTDQNLADWQSSYEFWTASKANRQINWDRLYYSNQQLAAQGKDAMYYIQAKNNDQLMLTLSSALKMDLTKNSSLNLGLNLQTTKGMHYQTMEDLLGATVFHNINTYALGTYAGSSNEVQYDLNNPNGEVREGDKFGYNYNLLVDKANVWTTYKHDFNQIHTFLSGRVGATSMQRDGKMRNGLAANNSYGKSGTARFLDGGVKAGATFSDGPYTMTWGLGYELRTPTASTAFVSPEINNDFVSNLKNERIFSAELGYYMNFSWLNISLNGYYSLLTN